MLKTRKVNQKSLEKLRSMLIHGDRKKIAEALNKPAGYIRQVLTGNISNLDVIEYTISFIQKNKRNNVNRINEKIKSL